MSKALWGGLALLALLTFQQSFVWRSDLTLWQQATRGSTKPRPWINYGTALYLSDRADAAQSAFQRGLTYAAARHDRDGIAIATTNLAYVDLTLGHRADAQARLRAYRAAFPSPELMADACRAVQC